MNITTCIDILLYIYYIGVIIAAILVTRLMKDSKKWSVGASVGASFIWPILIIIGIFCVFSSETDSCD